MQVFFIVTGPTPDIDIAPVNGSVVFQEGQSNSAIVLQILSDQTPELDEEYTVTLTSVTGDTVLNTNTITSTFKIL